MHGEDVKDVTWFDASGTEMTAEAWEVGWVKNFGVRWAGDMIPGTDERGRPMIGDTLLLLFNAHHDAIPFHIPEHKDGQGWDLLFDTSDAVEPNFHDTEIKVYQLKPRSMAVLRTFNTLPDEDPTPDVMRKWPKE